MSTAVDVLALLGAGFSTLGVVLTIVGWRRDCVECAVTHRNGWRALWLGAALTTASWLLKIPPSLPW